MKSQILGVALGCLISVSPLVGQQVVDHQRAAAAALKSQLSQEGHDCPEAHTQYDENICIGKVEEATKKDFDTFYQSLRAVLGTDSELDKDLEAAQEQWSRYVTKSCDAIERWHQHGSIRWAADSQCVIQLTRSRMRDLDGLYYTVLHD